MVTLSTHLFPDGARAARKALCSRAAESAQSAVHFARNEGAAAGKELHSSATRDMKALCSCRQHEAGLELIIIFLSLLLQKINKSSDKIQVRDLQLVTR